MRRGFGGEPRSRSVDALTGVKRPGEEECRESEVVVTCVLSAHSPAMILNESIETRSRRPSYCGFDDAPASIPSSYYGT